MPQAQARRTAGTAELLDIDLGESYMVGDRRDTEAGQRAAAKIILGSWAMKKLKDWKSSCLSAVSISPACRRGSLISR